MQLTPDRQATERFAASLNRLIPTGERIGLAVSGGPDSLALLLLAAAARPGAVDAASVDHRLRTASAAECERVAALCEQMSVPHATLSAQWEEAPQTAIQQRARAERYRLLSGWMAKSGLTVLATAHHLDDQAETLLMRLARGAGVRGLAAIRPAAPVPGGKGRLVRPLLGWRRSELAQVCDRAGIDPIADPSNEDEQFERVRVRKALGEADWLDPKALARSAANLAMADVALDWAAAQEWQRSVESSVAKVVYRPGAAPVEIRRRIAVRAVGALASEAVALALRGAEVDRLVAMLGSGETSTLRGVRCTGGDVWRFVPAPPRRKKPGAGKVSA